MGEENHGGIGGTNWPSRARLDSVMVCINFWKHQNLNKDWHVQRWWCHWYSLIDFGMTQELDFAANCFESLSLRYLVTWIVCGKWTHLREHGDPILEVLQCRFSLVASRLSVSLCLMSSPRRWPQNQNNQEQERIVKKHARTGADGRPFKGSRFRSTEGTRTVLSSSQRAGLSCSHSPASPQNLEHHLRSHGNKAWSSWLSWSTKKWKLMSSHTRHLWLSLQHRSQLWCGKKRCT